MDLRTLAPRALLADIVACIRFYTRIPLPASAPSSQHFATAQWAAPITGLLVGLTGSVVLWAALWAGLAATAAAVVSLAATMLITGALHEDGTADVADGFGGGATRERKLEIMKDSRIGAYGVCALVLTILARWSALTALAAMGGWAIFIALISAHAAARALMPAFMMLVAPARADGLSAGVGRIEQPAVFTALGIGAVALLFGGIGFAIATAAVLVLWFYALKRLCERQIGGQTGDVLGALEQGGEIIVMFAAGVFLL
jgi:adenosylcobinamide-GDP ribazoletransferase